MSVPLTMEDVLKSVLIQMPPSRVLVTHGCFNADKDWIIRFTIILPVYIVIISW